MAEITTGYWLLTDDQIKDDMIFITPPQDILPIAYFKVFNEVSYFSFDDVKYHIIHSVISNDVLDQFIKEFGDNPFTPECTDQINISDIWLGSTKKEMMAKVLERFNIDLMGEREISTEADGTPIMSPYLIESSMAGQSPDYDVDVPEVLEDTTTDTPTEHLSEEDLGVLDDTPVSEVDTVILEEGIVIPDDPGTTPNDEDDGVPTLPIEEPEYPSEPPEPEE